MSAWGTKRLVIAIAKTQVGYHEVGNNQNKYSRAFGRPAEAWCADGLSWVFAKARVPDPINTASSIRMLDAARQLGGDKGRVAGAVVRYTISHVELVIDDHGHTIGFNTTATANLSVAAQRSGGAVAVKTTSRLHVDGYGMPAYAHDDGSDLWPVFPYVRLLKYPHPHVGVVGGYQTGPDVRRVQHKVGAVTRRGGHEHSDGQYGPHTADLVARWQKRHGLKADGQVGSVTWSAMF